MNRLFDDPQFIKPVGGGNKNNNYFSKDELESPRQVAMLMTPDALQPQNRDRKNSFESYFHHLRKDSDSDMMMKKYSSPSANGFKLRSPNIGSGKFEGIASYLNLNSNNQMDSFQLEEPAKEDLNQRNNMISHSQLNITIGQNSDK